MLGPAQGWAGYLFVKEELSGRVTAAGPSASARGPPAVQSEVVAGLQCLNRQESNNCDETGLPATR